MSESLEKVKRDEILVDIDAIDIQLRPARQMRVDLDPEALEQYAERLDEMPPVKLMFDEASNMYWVIDGAHTITAAWAKGRKEVNAIVQEGGLLDAWKLAAHANDAHGVRVTNADKRHRVEEALKIPAMAVWSDRRIAEWCCVSAAFVGPLRPKPTVNDLQSPRIGLDGRACKPPRPSERPAPPRSPSLPAESQADPETNGHAEPDESTPVDSAPEPQRMPEAIDAAAARWSRVLNDYCQHIRSFEKVGGVKELTRNWPRERVEMLLRTMREASRSFQQLGDQLEEMLA